MEAWARDAVGKILMMLKVLVCGAEDGPAVGRRAGPCDDTKQTSIKPKAGRGPNKRESANDSIGCGEAFYVHTCTAFLFLL